MMTGAARRAASGHVTRCVAAAMAGLVAASMVVVSEAEVVYQTDFSTLNGQIWDVVSPTGVGPAAAPWSTVPRRPADRFLGEFIDQTVTLTLGNLPEHTFVRLRFDLYAIRTWDGVHRSDPSRDDVFTVTVNGRRVLHTSFCNGYADQHPDARQSYPGTYPYDVVLPRTAAIGSDSLGYVYTGGGRSYPADTTYRIELLVRDYRPTLQVRWQAHALTRTMGDESWGIDNVEVEVIAAADALAVPAGGVLSRLGVYLEGDAVRSAAAMPGLVVGWDEVRPYLAGRLEELFGWDA